MKEKMKPHFDGRRPHGFAGDGNIFVKPTAAAMAACSRINITDHTRFKQSSLRRYKIHCCDSTL